MRGGPTIATLSLLHAVNTRSGFIQQQQEPQLGSAAGPTMSALGHVWTAPWQELSDVGAALVGCGHVSGLLIAAGVAAGPNALRGSGPNR